MKTMTRRGITPSGLGINRPEQGTETTANRTKRPTATSASAISRDKFVGFVRELLGAGVSGYPDPDNPQPPGPWDPVIRKALGRIEAVLGPHPEPWKPNPGEAVGLNPQPLPPKVLLALLIAQEVAERALYMQEIADALPRAGQQQGIIIVGGLVGRFVEDCGNDRLWSKRPFPPPRGEDDNRLSPVELVAMGVQFEQAAREAFHQGVKEQFERAGASLIELGLGRM